MNKKLPPTPALLRKWKRDAERFRKKGDFYKYRELSDKIENCPLKEVEMSDGRTTYMIETND